MPAFKLPGSEQRAFASRLSALDLPSFRLALESISAARFDWEAVIGLFSIPLFPRVL
jgi:hypothetical protein